MLLTLNFLFGFKSDPWQELLTLIVINRAKIPLYLYVSMWDIGHISTINTAIKGAIRNLHATIG